MMVLDLRCDCLANPERLDLAVVEAMMLWPDDASKRDLAVAAALPASFGLTSALRALEGEAKARFLRGFIAGHMLRQAVMGCRLGDTNKMLAGLFAKDKTAPAELRRISVKTINNSIWPTFRSVAPFWASYVEMKIETGQDVFPCRRADLSKFLLTAESFRSLAETTRTHPKAGCILRAGESVVIPVLNPPPGSLPD